MTSTLTARGGVGLGVGGWEVCVRGGGGEGTIKNTERLVGSLKRTRKRYLDRVNLFSRIPLEVPRPSP